MNRYEELVSLDQQEHAQLLEEHAQSWRRAYAGKKLPRDLFPLLLETAANLREMGRAQASLELLDATEGMGINRFLTHRIDKARQTVLSLFAAGRSEEAEEIIRYYVRRPYVFNDQSKLGFFLLHDAQYNITRNDKKALIYDIRLMLHTSGGDNGYVVRLCHLLENSEHYRRICNSLPLLDNIAIRVTMLANRGFFANFLVRGLDRLRRVVQRLARTRGRNIAWLLPRAEGSAKKKYGKRPIIVARAMGGIGDLMMMTPGLRALKKKYPKRNIYFAIPRSFHALFKDNPYFELLDIFDEDIRYYKKMVLYNLTDCPAGKVESMTFPRVKKNRIDIFAEAMGIGWWRLWRYGRRPVYAVTAEEEAWAREYLARLSVPVGEFIAIQPYAADTYKDYPHMEELALRLAEINKIVIFHNQEFTGYIHNNILKITNYTLRKSIALLSLAKLLVSVDSAFMHIAASFELETIGIFGPTDGRVFTKNYKNCHHIQSSYCVNCTPCWRNQNIICAKSKSILGNCMLNLKIEEIKNIIGDEK